MCYFWGDKGCFATNPKEKPNILDINLIRHLIGELGEVAYISLFGGEPLTYPHLEDLIQMVKEKGYHINTPSNGTLLDKQAEMLVETGFDLMRVSIDGTQEINDLQRGRGSYDKAMHGLECLHQEKIKAKVKMPGVELLYTITPDTYLAVEDFFLKDLDLTLIDSVTFQMENFISEEMGLTYAKMIKEEFGISSESYWRGMLRSPDHFNSMDITELTRQICKVQKCLKDRGKTARILPPTCSHDNFLAYFNAEWDSMIDRYSKCRIPWVSVEVTASGDVAPCHIFYDLTFGNLYERSLNEIWNGEMYNKFRTYLRKNGLMSICNGCCILYL
jgi:radical SAM protein with 4Fe4S-binding SPASM domain